MADLTIDICRRTNISWLVFFYLMILANMVNTVMMKQECPPEETHKSCWFYKEYTCWEDERRLNRVMILPQRLMHCTTACYCKQGYVRAYPNGPCILAPYCMDERIKNFLRKLPA